VAVEASPQHAQAIEAIGNLLTTLRLEFMFVGEVARVAWLGGSIDSGPVDVVAAMQPQQKSQIVMMAHNHGFGVEREEIDAAEELDLVPLTFGGVRIHVLVASNALYARMIRDAWEERFGGKDWRVPAREDLAILLALGDQDDALRNVIALPEFDRELYNEKVTSIGLRGLAV
jgi:hypothetical protein